MSSKGKQELKRLKASLEESRVNGQDTAEGPQLDQSHIDFQLSMATVVEQLNKIYNHTHEVSSLSQSPEMESIRIILSNLQRKILPKMSISIGAIIGQYNDLKEQTARWAYMAGIRSGKSMNTQEEIEFILRNLEEIVEERTRPRSLGQGPYFNE